MWLQHLQNNVIQHLQALLTDAGKERFIREDYREVAELTLVLLGAGPSQPRFRRPGAYHHARWMAKASEEVV